MAIRLLSTYDSFPPQSILTLAPAIEAALIADGNASATLTGGTVAYRARQPVMIQPAVQRHGSVDLIANRKAIVPLSEGTALTITPTAGTTGTMQRYDSAGTAVGAAMVIGILPTTLGPFTGDQSIEIKCTTGALTARVDDAAPALTRGANNAAVGLSTPEGYRKPLLRSTKAPTGAGWGGLKPTLSYAGGTANSNWHMTRTAARSFYGVEVAYASVDGANGTIDRTAVAASSSLATQASKYTPDQAWAVSAGGVAVPTAGGTTLVPNLASTGFLACRSVARADGGKYPVAHIRTYIVSAPPAYTAVSAPTAWNAANPDRPYYLFRKGGSDMTGANQANFNDSNGEASLLVVAGVKFYYDTVGICGLGIGDSIMGGDSNIDGAPLRASYSERAAWALQDQGLPVDFINGALSGDVWVNYSARGKAMIDFHKPTFATIPSFSPNDTYATQADIDLQWRHCMDLVEYCVAANVVPIIVTPMPKNTTTATTDGYRLQNRDRALASGFYCLDVEDLVSDRATPARWLAGMCDDAPTPGTHPNANANAVVGARLATLLRAIFF